MDAKKNLTLLFPRVTVVKGRHPIEASRPQLYLALPKLLSLVGEYERIRI